MTATPHGSEHAPLVSPRFLYTLTAAVIGLAALTASISVAGRWYGDRLALAGHTTSTDAVDLFIGQDHLRLPANVIRFDQQRTTGRAERVDLYLTWPKLDGYSDATRDQFNDVGNPAALIFVEISQSTMSRDMSGRLQPIYQHIFQASTQSGPAGLTRHDLKPNSGYGDEIFLTADRADGAPYVVRCLMPKTPEGSTSADCQRDVHAGQDLVVLYRFSSQLLPQWQSIDAAVRDYVGKRIIP